jgi:hypothetical protein
MTQKRGELRTEFVVNCGRCGNEERVGGIGNRMVVALFIRDQGWLHTRLRGWLCPDCKDKGETG